MSKLKVASLFSGIGGFETGVFKAFGKENVEVVFASEIDKFASQSYEIVYGHKPSGDIMKIDEEVVPNHDILVGGFPCQDLSIAGNRAGISVKCDDCEHTFEIEDDIFNSECPSCMSGKIVPATRSALFFEIARIARAKQPKVMLLENVKGLLSHQKGKTMETVVKTLSNLGYKVDFDIVNSKFFGVPQNRERVFIVAVKETEAQEWDIPKVNNVVTRAKKKIATLGGIKTFNFEFPKSESVDTCLKDILEQTVDEKYYLSEEKTKNLLERLNERHKDRQEKFLIDDQGRKNKELKPLDISPTLRREMHGNEPRVVEKYNDMKMVGLLDMKGNESIRRVYDPNGVGPTLTTMGGGHREPKIIEPQEFSNNGEGISYTIDANYVKGTSVGNIGKGRRTHVLESDQAAIEKEILSLTERRTEEAKRLRKEYREKYGKDFSPRRAKELVPREDELANCLTATQTIEQHLLGKPFYRIRKLTPLECFRLQGFPDEYVTKLRENGISDTQLYKMSGNAVTTNVIQSIVSNFNKYISI